MDYERIEPAQKSRKQTLVKAVTRFQILVFVMYFGAPLINVLASNVPILDFNCIPCITFGMYYCYDDPWVVQFNGDKCYQYYIDRLECEAT